MIRKFMKFLYTRTIHISKFIYFFIIEIFHPKSIAITPYIPFRGYYKLTNNNLGDDLSVVIAKFVSGKRIIPFQYSIFAKLNLKTNYSCIGSIIPWGIQSNTIVWGSGIGVTSLPLVNFKGKISAVRGPLTREYLLSQGIDCPEIYGDPALLLPYFYNPIRKSKYKIGVILHERDKIQSNYNILDEYSPNELTLIELLNYGKWQNFVDKICECDLILSSSLHGCIISDTYNIPNLWTEFTYIVEENGLKFRDYYLSVNKKINNPQLKMQSFIPIDEIYALKAKWNPINFNSELLLENCPFK